MSILELPRELLLSIARIMDSRELNALLQCHSYLYNTLNDYLYQRNVQYHDASALFWAASTGSETTLQRLLDAGANVQWESQYLACSIPYAGTPFRQRAEDMKEHPISYAATNGHTKIVNKLADLGVDINYRNADGMSPLALAAREGHLALVQTLVARDAKQLSHDTEGRYPLAQAALKGHHIIENYLFQELRRYRHSKMNPQLDLHWMLKYAAERGDEDRIRYLLSQGADINFQLPVESHPPLCGALEFVPSPVGTVKLLLENGANPNIKASWSKDSQAGRREPDVSPIRLALERKESYFLVELLLQHGAEALKQSQTLTTAVRYEKDAEFQLLLENGANVFAKYRRVSVAERARKSECRPIIGMLLERKLL